MNKVDQDSQIEIMKVWYQEPNFCWLSSPFYSPFERAVIQKSWSEGEFYKKPALEWKFHQVLGKDLQRVSEVHHLWGPAGVCRVPPADAAAAATAAKAATAAAKHCFTFLFGAAALLSSMPKHFYMQQKL